MFKILILLLISTINIYAQSSEFIYKNEIFEVNYSKKVKGAIWLKYKLYKGGGPCDRSKYSFKPFNYTAKNSDYLNAGYDRGHLANAEDFAFSCRKDSLTFLYINCVPQTHNLNAGIWKTDEEFARDYSQKDSILIICGNVYGTKFIGKGVGIPSTCWKIVQSLRSKNILLCKIYTNLPEKNTSKEMTIMQLEKFIGYKLTNIIK